MQPPPAPSTSSWDSHPPPPLHCLRLARGKHMGLTVGERRANHHLGTLAGDHGPEPLEPDKVGSLS